MPGCLPRRSLSASQRAIRVARPPQMNPCESQRTATLPPHKGAFFFPANRRPALSHCGPLQRASMLAAFRPLGALVNGQRCRFLVQVDCMLSNSRGNMPRWITGAYHTRSASASNAITGSWSFISRTGKRLRNRSTPHAAERKRSPARSSTNGWKRGGRKPAEQPAAPANGQRCRWRE